MADIVLPHLGEGVVSATLVCWHAKTGDAIQAGQDICEVVTDKATFNIEAPSQGVLTHIHVDEGKDAKIGAVLGVIK